MENLLYYLYNRRIVFIALIISCTGILSCEKYSFKPPEIDPGIEISFQADIQPVFNSKCLACHGSGKNRPYLDEANSYSDLNTRGYINVTTPENSKLYTQMTSGSGHTTFLNTLQKQTLLEWIRQGAKNN